jgi:hypothetical protein
MRTCGDVDDHHRGKQMEKPPSAMSLHGWGGMGK